MPAPNRRGIKRWCCLTSVCLASDVWLSVAYIGPKSRTERPRKTKIGTEVAHVSRDWDTTYKIKRSKVKVTRPLYSPPCWRVRQLQRLAWERVGRGKLLLRCRLLGRARPFGAHEGGEGRGISWRPPTYSLFLLGCQYHASASNWLEKVISKMSYNVLMGTLNPTHSLTH